MDWGWASQQSPAVANLFKQQLVIDIPLNHSQNMVLPLEFWSRMNLYLSYADILKLGCLNRAFRAAAVENYIPWDARIAIIRKHELDRNTIARNAGRQRQGCYLCFRMRDKEEFPISSDMVDIAEVLWHNAYTGQKFFRRTNQSPLGQLIHPLPLPQIGTSGAGTAAGMDSGYRIRINPRVRPPDNFPLNIVDNWSGWVRREGLDQTEFLHRHCADCAVKKGLYVPGDGFRTENRRKARNRWVCNCPEYHDSPSNNDQNAVLRCATCGRMVVLASRSFQTQDKIA